MSEKQQATISNTTTGMVNCGVSSYISELYKLVKIYKFQKLIEIYTLSKSGYKNAFPLDKRCKNIVILFHNQ